MRTPRSRRTLRTARYYEITAVVNGEIKTLNVKAGSNSAVEALVKNIDTTNAARIGTSSKYVVALKSITENADGFVTSAKVYEKLDSDNDGVLDTSSKLYVTGTKKAEDGTVGLANKLLCLQRRCDRGPLEPGRPGCGDEPHQLREE